VPKQDAADKEELMHSDEFMRVLGQTIEDTLYHFMGERIGFALLVFPFGEPDPEAAVPGADYISNAERGDMVKFLRETADRLENHEDFGPVEGRA
jgi:hypothetical protein